MNTKFDVDSMTGLGYWEWTIGSITYAHITLYTHRAEVLESIYHSWKLKSDSPGDIVEYEICETLNWR